MRLDTISAPKIDMKKSRKGGGVRLDVVCFYNVSIQYSRREKCALGITKDNVLEFYHRRPSTGLSSYGFAEMKKKSIIRKKVTKSKYIEILNT